MRIIRTELAYMPEAVVERPSAKTIYSLIKNSIGQAPIEKKYSNLNWKRIWSTKICSVQNKDPHYT